MIHKLQNAENLHHEAAEKGTRTVMSENGLGKSSCVELETILLIQCVSYLGVAASALTGLIGLEKRLAMRSMIRLVYVKVWKIQILVKCMKSKT